MPHAEYERRRSDRQGLAGRLSRRNELLSSARLVVFFGGLAAFFVAVQYQAPLAVAVIAGGAPLAAFVTLVTLHQRGKRALDRAHRAAAHYDRGLARLNGHWQGHGNAGLRYKDPNHLYAEDLDLFGRGSLFELLCTARTRLGGDTLGSWLNAPASLGEIRARQEAVRELCGELDLREDLAVLGQEMQEELDPEILTRWSAQVPVLTGVGLRRGAYALTAAAMLALAATAIHSACWSLVVLLFLAAMLYLHLVRKRIEAVAHVAEGLSRHLDLLYHVLCRLEQTSFRSPKLATLRSCLDTAGEAPSRAILRLRRLTDRYHTTKQNAILAVLGIFLLLPLHVAYAMEAWRRCVGPRIAVWLLAVGEFEALLCLGGYAYEHPKDPFPEMVEGEPFVEGTNVGHPLLLEATCVRNDVRLVPGEPLLIVSGSNMSGKTTYLRTVGVNTVLAQAGAPVRAERFRVSPLAVGCSIRILDSLQEGRSHFYAEMARLRDIVNSMGGDRGVLFLLDELMHGTNSGDRRIGAEAVLRKLVAGGAVGMVTTHDLALAEIVDTFDRRARNAHFEYRLVDGGMAFDYRLRPGVVEKSNALAVMRSLGLDV